MPFVLKTILASPANLSFLNRETVIFGLSDLVVLIVYNYFNTLSLYFYVLSYVLRLLVLCNTARDFDYLLRLLNCFYSDLIYVVLSVISY